VRELGIGAIHRSGAAARKASAGGVPHPSEQRGSGEHAATTSHRPNRNRAPDRSEPSRCRFDALGARLERPRSRLRLGPRGAEDREFPGPPKHSVPGESSPAPSRRHRLSSGPSASPRRGGRLLAGRHREKSVKLPRDAMIFDSWRWRPAYRDGSVGYTEPADSVVANDGDRAGPLRALGAPCPERTGFPLRYDGLARDRSAPLS
jgi:hypothetical protein